MAAKKDLVPGLPMEVVSSAETIMEKLHELYGNHGILCPVNILFAVRDDLDQLHDLVFRFDQDRGSGEYVLVIA